MATALSTGRRDEREELAEIEQYYRTELARPAEFPPVAWQPVRIGPTWQTDGRHWLLPEHTLGWGFLAWCGRWLQESRGVGWRFTLEQARFLLWWYAVQPSGRFLYRDGVFQRLKGHGKDPLGACLSAGEMLGPVRVVDWDRGQPVGGDVAAAWVQTAAVSLKQTKNTMRLFPALFSAEAKLRYGIQIGREQVHALGDERFMEAVTSSPTTLEGARSSFVLMNEALSLDVRIPTPNGWSTVNAVSVGDRIFGSNGPTTVTHVTPVYEGRPCYRVAFEDDTELVADEGHLWLSRPTGSGAKPRVRTTREMAEDPRRFAVPKMSPFDAPPLDLPLDPYVLGLWLGDGDVKAAGITVGREDLPFMLAEVQRRGVPAAATTKTRDDRAARISLMGNAAGQLYTKDGSSVRGALIKLGVLGDKHVPPDLLRASRDQRLDLLRGLMDADGCCTKLGLAVFVNSNRQLFDGVVELVRSLGYTAHVQSVTDTRWPKNPTSYRLTFRPDDDLNPFLLPRKAERVLAPSRRRWKVIRSIEPTESVPVKCIEVDAEDHLFVAGDGWTVTHNTHHWLSNNEGHEMAATIERNTTKAKGGAARTLRITNAYEPGEDSVAERDREAWEKAQSGEVVDVGLLYDSLEAPPEAPLTPEAAPSVVEAIRGDSVWLDTESIVKSIIDIRNPPSRSRRFWFNQITAAEDAWMDPQQWDAIAAPDQLVLPNEPIVAFFDGSKSDDSTGLVGCRLSDGHVFVIDCWAKPAGERGRSWIVDRQAVDEAVTAMFDAYKVIAFFADPSDTRDDTGERFWEPFVDDWHTRYGPQLKLWSVQSGDRRHSISWDMRSREHVNLFTGAAERFVAEVAAGRMSHDGDIRLRQHVRNARRRPNDFGVSLGKEHRESARKVDLAVCAVGARMLRRLYQNKDTSTKTRTGKVW